MILFGKILRTHGLHGRLKCMIFFPNFHDLLQKELYIQTHNSQVVNNTILTISTSYCMEINIWIVAFHQINDINIAKTLVNSLLFALSSNMSLQEIPKSYANILSTFIGHDVYKCQILRHNQQNNPNKQLDILKNCLSNDAKLNNKTSHNKDLIAEKSILGNIFYPSLIPIYYNQSCITPDNYYGKIEKIFQTIISCKILLYIVSLDNNWHKIFLPFCNILMPIVNPIEKKLLVDERFMLLAK